MKLRKLLEMMETPYLKSEYKIKRSEKDSGQWAKFGTFNGVDYFKKVKLFGLFVWRQDGKYDHSKPVSTSKKERPLTDDEQSQNLVWRVIEFFE